MNLEFIEFHWNWATSVVQGMQLRECSRKALIAVTDFPRQCRGSPIMWKCSRVCVYFQGESLQRNTQQNVNMHLFIRYYLFRC